MINWFSQHLCSFLTIRKLKHMCKIAETSLTTVYKDILYVYMSPLRVCFRFVRRLVEHVSAAGKLLACYVTSICFTVKMLFTHFS